MSDFGQNFLSLIYPARTSYLISNIEVKRDVFLDIFLQNNLTQNDLYGNWEGS